MPRKSFISQFSCRLSGRRTDSLDRGAINTKMLDKAKEAGGAVSGDGMSPIDRMGTPDEVAKLIAFLLCEDSSFTTGAVYTIDGGMTP